MPSVSSPFKQFVSLPTVTKPKSECQGAELVTKLQALNADVKQETTALKPKPQTHWLRSSMSQKPTVQRALNKKGFIRKT
nr:hypothetical protein BCV14_10310 [Vibrio cyclitrophicus]